MTRASRIGNLHSRFISAARPREPFHRSQQVKVFPIVVNKRTVVAEQFLSLFDIPQRVLLKHPIGVNVLRQATGVDVLLGAAVLQGVVVQQQQDDRSPRRVRRPRPLQDVARLVPRQGVQESAVGRAVREERVVLDAGVRQLAPLDVPRGEHPAPLAVGRLARPQGRDEARGRRRHEPDLGAAAPLPPRSRSRSRSRR